MVRRTSGDRSSFGSRLQSRATFPAARRSNIALAYVGSCLKNLQFFGAVAVPFFIDWLGVDFTKAFLLQAWFLFWVSALEIPTGVVADRFGRKLSVALGCLLFSADMLVFGLVRSYPALFVAEFLGAVGMTLMSGAEQALLYDSLVDAGLEDRAPHYFARYEAAGTLGLLLSFPVGSFIGGQHGRPGMLPVPFVMTAVSGVLAAAVFFAMTEPTRTKPTQGFIRMGVEGLRTLFVHDDLRSYTLNAVTISAVTFFVFWLYQPVLQRAGLAVSWLGVVAAGFNLFSTVLLSQSAVLERAVGLRRLLFLTAILPAGAFATLAAVHRIDTIVAVLFLLVGCRMVRIPLLNGLINRHIKSENRATVMSAVSLVERFVTFALYPLVGWSTDRSLDITLVAMGVLCAVFALATRVSRVATERV
jgi:MFS family permease